MCIKFCKLDIEHHVKIDIHLVHYIHPKSSNIRTTCLPFVFMAVNRAPILPRSQTFTFTRPSLQSMVWNGPRWSTTSKR